MEDQECAPMDLKRAKKRWTLAPKKECVNVVGAQYHGFAPTVPMQRRLVLEVCPTVVPRAFLKVGPRAAPEVHPEADRRVLHNVLQTLNRTASV